MAARKMVKLTKQVEMEVEKEMWVGKCPTCGKEQIRGYEDGVDIICGDCRFRIKEDEKSEMMELFSNSVVVGIEYLGGINNPNKTVDEINSITINTPNGVYVIYGVSGGMHMHELV